MSDLRLGDIVALGHTDATVVGFTTNGKVVLTDDETTWVVDADSKFRLVIMDHGPTLRQHVARHIRCIAPSAMIETDCYGQYVIYTELGV